MATVKELRIAKGWSQQELASRSNVSFRTIYRIEKGHSAIPVTINAIANALGVKPDEVSVNVVKRVGKQ